MMDWVTAFYARQNEWCGVYTGDVTADARQKVTAIERLAGPAHKRVLELGAGGGQNAVAAAELGHTVVAVELMPEFVAHGQTLAAWPGQSSLTVLQGDFYTIDLDQQFDLVCYWDGFGVGTDQDQRRLCQRIASWLAHGGCALLDIYTPWFWAAAAGQEMDRGSARRRYDFDAHNCRLLDHWWLRGDESSLVTQSIRCYSPVDLRLMLEGTGLILDYVEPGGAVDYARGVFIEQAPLNQAMAYTARLIHAT